MNLRIHLPFCTLNLRVLFGSCLSIFLFLFFDDPTTTAGSSARTGCWDPMQEPGVGNIPRPNAPLRGILAGIRQYESMGIPTSKLVIGLPWYGYTTECRTNSTGDPCEMPCDGDRRRIIACVLGEIPEARHIMCTSAHHILRNPGCLWSHLRITSCMIPELPWDQPTE